VIGGGAAGDLFEDDFGAAVDAVQAGQGDAETQRALRRQ